MKRIALAVTAGALLGAVWVGPDASAAWMYEDGNPDGTECVWTDPDTGNPYYVDSSNYWSVPA